MNWETNTQLPSQYETTNGSDQRYTELEQSQQKEDVSDHNCSREQLRILSSGGIRSQLQLQVRNVLHPSVPHYALCW